MKPPDWSADDLRADKRVFWVEDVLRYGDMDPNGHVNNSVFAVLCESGRVAFLNEHLRSNSGGYLVIARLEIDFRRELTYPGRVATATWLTRLGRSSFELRQALFDDAERLAATSFAVCVAMETATRRPWPIDGERRAPLESCLRPAEDE